MSQHDYVLDNQDGASFRQDINAVLQAIASLNSGATEPATPYAYMLWQDTTAGVIKQRNAANTGWTTLLPILDGSITQAKLASGVVGTGAAFSAYQSSAQTLTGNTLTKIQFQTEEFDTNSRFNNTGSTVGGIPAYAFVPNVAGYYQVNASVNVATSATPISATIYKNGVAYKQLQNVSASTGGVGGSALIDLNGSTDYVEIYATITTGQALAAQKQLTYFQASMVRAA